MTVKTAESVQTIPAARGPALEHKQVPISVKVLDAAEGIVEIFVAGIGNEDEVGDIIEPGAFADSLKARTPKGVVSHKFDTAWAVAKCLEAREVAAGDSLLPQRFQDLGAGAMYVKAQYLLSTQAGREAFERVKFYGDEQEWSIGYVVPDGGASIKAGVRHLKRIDWYEWSDVLFGANRLTGTVSIKSAEGTKAVDGSFEEVQDELRSAIREAEGTGNGRYCYIVATFADTVVYEVWGETVPSQTFQRSYSVDADGQVTLGDREEVEIVQTVQAAKDDALDLETKAAIAAHSTETSDSAWDGPKQKAAIPNDAGKPVLRKMFAWVDGEGDDAKKAAYKFIHHFYSDGPGAASTKACSTGIAVLNGGRGGTVIPSADRKGVYSHLAKHLRDADMTPPDLKDLKDLGPLSDGRDDDARAAIEALEYAIPLLDSKAGARAMFLKRPRVETLLEQLGALLETCAVGDEDPGSKNATAAEPPPSAAALDPLEVMQFQMMSVG